jgi:DNA-binding MarR family transcriptional regulator
VARRLFTILKIFWSIQLTSKIDGLALDEQLCFATYTAAQAFSRVYRPLLDPLGLTYPQYLVMLVLWEGDDIPIGKITARIHLDSGTLTPLLKRMENSGLIARHRNPDDEREVRVTLTPQGRGLRSKVATARAEVACATNLDTADISALKQQLLQLRTDLLANLPNA